jgi:lysozyme family protein
LSFEQSFENLLPWEGGYGDDPRDPGGATNLGIIQTEYSADRRARGLQTRSVLFITKDEARAIYLKNYWTPLKCDNMDAGLANCVFDSGVNSGIGKGALWLQQAINSVAGTVIVPEHGEITAATLAAASHLDPGALIDRLLAIRLAFLKRARNPETGALLWTAFGGGWSDRIVGVRKQSHALAGLPEPKSKLKEVLPMPTPSAPIASNSTSGLNLSTLQIINAFITSIFGALTGVGGPIAILAQGTSWGHYIAAGATAVAGVAAVLSPILTVVNANLAAIDNTVAAVAGTIANAASTPVPSSAPQSA